MDHLILPRNPIGPPLNIPALSSDGYDGGDYVTYPDRAGWAPRTVAKWQEIFERPTPEFRAFLQRWIYHGFAYLAFDNFEPEIAVNDKYDFRLPFIRTRYLTSNIENILSQGAFKRRANKHFNLLKVCGDIQYSLTENWENKRASQSALAEVEGLLTFIRIERPKNPLEPVIMLSVCLLWELLLAVLSYDKRVSQVGADLNKPPVLSESQLRSLLKQAGWCPWEVTHIINGLTAHGIIFMLNLERPRPSEDHWINCMQDEHQQTAISGGCTPVYCRHRNLLQDTYRTSHVDGCLWCEEVIADPDLLANVLLSGTVPLISTTTPEQEERSLSIHPSNELSTYVAISHVWSDGLGNLHANAIPRCQLNRLNSLIRSLPLQDPKPPLFWLDTLCVPPDSAGSDKAQTAALSKMRETYENATAVLVLDAWLTSCAISELSPNEILMRIFQTTWNRRLWTYQEGALANLLFFQFQDGVVEIDSYYRDFCESRSIMVALTLGQSLDQKWQSLRNFQKQGAGHADILRHITPTLGTRATSVAEDEALCLATLLNLDIQRLVQVPPTLRMECLWGMIDVVPSDILIGGHDTLDKPGLRWAPKSLLISASNFNHFGRYSPIRMQNIAEIPLARVTPTGLRFQQSGIVFNVRQGRLGEAFMLKDNKGAHHFFHVHFRKDREYGDYGSCSINGEYQRIPIIDILGFYGTSNMAFISMAAYDSRQTSDAVWPSQVGILVAILREEEGTFYGRKITTALREMKGSSSQLRDTSILDTLYTEADRILDFQDIPLLGQDMILHGVSGVRKPVTQAWCIE